ncbi:MAG: glycosyltransferase family 39 protein [Gammaproteobacteria bacterium]
MGIGADSMKKNTFYIDNFLLILFVYFCINLLVRVVISPNVGLDEAEQILLTQSLEWGYNSQPPLYTWMQYIYFKLFGNNIFALSLLKNTLLFLTYIFVYKSARLVTNDSILAVIATASLILIPQISWESQRALTHSVLLTCVSSIIIYFIFKIKYTAENVSIRYYSLLGLLIAIGMLTKYSFSIFIFAVLVASLMDEKLRGFILKKELIITFSIAAILLAPHILWFIDNISVVTNSTISKLSPDQEDFSFVTGIISLLKAILAFLAPLLIVSFLAFRNSLTNNGSAFIFHFFIIVIITLILFTIVTGATNYKDRWMQPYFFLMGIYIASKINIENLKSLNVAVYFSVVYLVMFLIVSVLIVRVYFPDITSRYSRLNYPFHALSHQINKIGFERGFIIAESKSIGGNMKLNFLDSTVSATGFERDVDNSKKILIVWERDFPAQADPYRHLIKEQEVIKSKYLYSNTNDYKLNIAIVENQNEGY